MRLPEQHDVWTSERLHISSTVFDPGAPVIVTFSPAGKPTREIFGGPLFRSRQINHISVSCAAPDWWQYQETPAAAQALREEARKFPRVVHYGSSMGAFGALYFSGWVEPDLVVALAPQYSIAPDEVPFETHWNKHHPRIAQLGGFLPERLAERMTRTGDVIIAFDPRNVDAAHIRLIENIRPVHRLIVPFGGHGLLFTLAQLGLASKIATCALHEMPDLAALRREIRAARPGSTNYMLGLIEALDARGRKDVPRFIRMALDHMSPEEAGQARQLATLATRHGQPELAAQCFVRQLDAAIIDGHSGLMSRLRQIAPALVQHGLAGAAVDVLRPWVEDTSLPDPRALAKTFNTLRRFDWPEQPTAVHARSATLLMKWCRIPDTTHLAMICKAILLHAMDDREAAIDLMTEATVPLGAWHPFNLEIARTWDWMGHPARAVPYARRVVAREPQNEQARGFLAYKLEATGSLEEAAALYAQNFHAASPDKPAWAASGLSWARCLRRMNEPRKALAPLATILAASPNSKPALAMMAQCLIALRHLDDAEACCQKILREHPDDAEATRTLARIAKEQKTSAAKAATAS